MIVVARPQFTTLLVEHLDMCPQRGQREWIERPYMLSIFGFAVRLNHAPVHNDAGYLDGERSGIQVKAARCARRGPALPAPGLCLGPGRRALAPRSGGADH
jgi:hypothetical protein